MFNIDHVLVLINLVRFLTTKILFSTVNLSKCALYSFVSDTFFSFWYISMYVMLYYYIYGTTFIAMIITHC